MLEKEKVKLAVQLFLLEKYKKKQGKHREFIFTLVSKILSSFRP